MEAAEAENCPLYIALVGDHTIQCFPSPMARMRGWTVGEWEGQAISHERTARQGEIARHRDGSVVVT